MCPHRMAPDVFISYARKNSAEAEKIERHLQQAGIQCYRDTQLAPGTPEWEQEIVKAVGQCVVLVVLLSQDSVVSKFVGRELALADDKGKKCIPVCLSRDVDLKHFNLRLACTQRLFAEPTMEAVLDELEKAVWSALDHSRNKTAYDAADLVTMRATTLRTITFSQERFGLWLGETERGTQKLVEDRFEFSTRPDGYLGSMMAELPRMTDFTAEVRTSKTGGLDGSWFGFEYGEVWPGNYCQFLLNGLGTVRVARHFNREWSELGTCEQVRFARRHDAVNTLKVVRNGTAIHLFVNGFHALSTKDGSGRVGNLGFVAGPELTVGFSELKLAAVELDARFEKCMAHREALEVMEARSVAREILDAAPDYRHPTLPADPRRIAEELRPDQRRSILIVIGYKVLPQIHDSRPANRLLAAINQLGDARQLKCAFLITDKALADEPIYGKCAFISVGGPESNATTATLCENLPSDPTCPAGCHIQQKIEHGDRRLALWGDSAEATIRAVDQFISGGLLRRYLDAVWKE